ALVNPQPRIALLQILNQLVGRLVNGSAIGILRGGENHAIRNRVLGDSCRGSYRGGILPGSSFPICRIRNTEIVSLERLQFAAGSDLLIADIRKSSRIGCTHPTGRGYIPRHGSGLLIL